MFSKAIYQQRRNELKAKITDGILLFLGNVEMPMNFADNPFPFRQDSSFLYYFGIQEPRLAAVIDTEEDETILFGNELSIDDIIWMGRQETLKSKAEKSGITEIRPFWKLSEYIKTEKNKGRRIHFLPTYFAENNNLINQLLDAKKGENEASVELINAVVAQRSRKHPEEIEEIEKAVNISNAMHLLAIRTAKPGMKEYELVSTIEKFAADNNCTFSYPAILTIHGEILHNHYRLNTMKIGDLLLNDSGVETTMGYAGDLTRTFPVDKKFTSRQREMYNVVLNAFEAAQAIMKPGLNFREVHRKAAMVLVEGLMGMGLLKGNPEEAVAQNVHTLFFQCGVGHMMGLDVHDMESLGEEYVGYTPEEPKDTQTFGWKSLRLGRPLEEGFVVTVEPGIYIIPELIDLWQKENKLSEFVNYDKINAFRDFGGIRIEDNFLITKDGYRRLGDGLIKTANEVEAVREQAF